MTPVLSEGQMKEAVKKFKDFLAENNAEIVYDHNWGLKKLAYPIQKKTTGFYNLLEFKAEGSILEKLELEFRRDERIMRYIIVALDKHAVAYNEKKRKEKKTKVEEKVEESKKS